MVFNDGYKDRETVQVAEYEKPGWNYENPISGSIPEPRGGLPGVFFEECAEIGRLGESQLVADFFGGKLREVEEAPGR